MIVTNMQQVILHRRLAVGLCPGWERKGLTSDNKGGVLLNIFYAFPSVISWFVEPFGDWDDSVNNAYWVTTWSLFGYAKLGWRETVEKKYSGPTQRNQQSSVPLSGVTVKCIIPKLNFDSTQQTDQKGIASFLLKKGNAVEKSTVDVCLVASGRDGRGAIMPETKRNVTRDFTAYQRWIDQEQKDATALEDKKRQEEENIKQAEIKRAEAFAVAMKKAEQAKGSTLVFKGLYLGMPIEDAYIICDKYKLTKVAVSSPGGTLIELRLDTDQLKMLFGISEINPSEFIDRFASEYKTPSPDYIPGDTTVSGIAGASGVGSKDRWKITDGKSYEVIFEQSTMMTHIMGISETRRTFTLTLRRPSGSFD